MTDGEKMVYAAVFAKYLSNDQYRNRSESEGGARYAAERATRAVVALRFGVAFPEGSDENTMWLEMVGLSRKH
jgi:hypothetical protein